MQCRITHAGPDFVRRLMAEAAQIAMRDCARDADVKLKGRRTCARGGRLAKREGGARRRGAQPHGDGGRAPQEANRRVCAALRVGKARVRGDALWGDGCAGAL